MDVDQAIDESINEMLLDLVKAKAKIGSDLEIRQQRMRCVVKTVDKWIRMGVVSYHPSAGHLDL